MMAPLDAGARRGACVEFEAWLEPARAQDEAVVAASMPRLPALSQTYPREVRPEESRGSAGTHRSREEPIARADIAPAPDAGGGVLFTGLMVR